MTGNDPASGPIDGTRVSGDHGGSDVLEQQDQMGPRLRPQTGWTGNASGRSREAADLCACGESVQGAGASLPGSLVSQCRRRQVTAKGRRWGGGEEGGEGKTEAPREQDSAEWPCVAVTAGSSLGQPLRGLPKPGDTSCVIISITVSYILTRRQHGVRHLPKRHMSQRPCKEQRQTPHSGGGRASGRAGAQACRPHTGSKPLCGRGRTSAPRSRFPHL